MENKEKQEVTTMVPNAGQCEGCPYWDDVNGCWRDVEDVFECLLTNDEGFYQDDE